MIDDIVFGNQIRKLDEVKLHKWDSLDQIELVEIDLTSNGNTWMLLMTQMNRVIHG